MDQGHAAKEAFFEHICVQPSSDGKSSCGAVLHLALPSAGTRNLRKYRGCTTCDYQAGCHQQTTRQGSRIILFNFKPSQRRRREHTTLCIEC